MADEGIRDAGATFFNLKAMNRWFFASVAVLTVAYFWSVVQDHDREFKSYQGRFFEMERQLSVQQGNAAFNAAGGATTIGDGAGNPGELREEIVRLQGMLAADHDKRPELALKLHDTQFHFDVKNAEMKMAKAVFEAERFIYEELAHHLNEHALEAPHSEEAKVAYEKYKDLKRKYEELDEANKQAEAARDAARDELARLDALAGDVAVKLEVAEREVGRLEKRADSLDSERLFTKFRNSIFFSFMSPTLAPKKIVVPEIFDDLNFLSVPKVDMCISCHLATDRFKDYPAGNSHVTFGDEKNALQNEDDSAAFRSHSKPELFCTSLSPHGQERFGCSGCHGGGNQRANFKQTWHTPTDAHEREVWEDELHWHPVHEWEYPMLGSKFLDASCYKCHQQEVHIQGAPTWNRGRDLVAKLGCFGCHKMAPFDGARRVGPPLGHVATKFSDLDFMLKWVDEPASFRPSTRMPAFFHRENRAMEPGRDAAEITALVAYLYNLSSPQALKSYPGNGDAAKGKQLFGESGGVGCMGCHGIDDFPEEVNDRVAKLDALRHGPELSGIGSKVTPDWLFTWLLDPKSLWPQTNMPNLRLTEQEAADLVAYLMTKRNVAFEQQVFEKPADDAPFEQILLEKLTERMTEARATLDISAMSGLEKRRKAGEYLLNHYGCFGCHDIPGYEDSKPIGAELNGWGSKHPDRLDFGMVEFEWKNPEVGKFNRESWIDQKLKNTRFYDRGKDKKPFEKLKMPQFSQLMEGVPDGDRDAVMTFVLSLVKDNTAESIKRHLTPDEAAVERGAKLVREKNCVGCHLLYGEGGEIRHFQFGEAGKAFYPPILDGQGARTQPEWLTHFLADPVFGKGAGAKAHLRPWMKARMPTFGFDQSQLNDIVAYFAHEKVWHTSTDRTLWDSIATKFRKDFLGYEEAQLRKADHTKVKLFHDLVARTYEKQGGGFVFKSDYPYMEKPAELAGGDLDKARNLFEKLQCVLCHMPGGVVPTGKSAADMAPDLSYARERLSPSWVRHWLEVPEVYQPGTRMPPFWKVEGGVRPSVDPDINDPEREMSLLRDYLFSSQFAADYERVAKKARGE